MNVVIAVVCILGLQGAAEAGPSSSFHPPGTALIHSRRDGSGMSLAQALQNKTITRLVIMPARLDVAAELEGLPSKFSLDRDVTVTGAQGTQTVWDQQFLRARLQLCGACTWTFANITVANDHKGSALDNELFVAAALGAKVILQDANVLRLACPSPADTSGVLSITPPSAAFQAGSGRHTTQQQQQHSTRDVVVQGRTYPGSLYIQSFSTDVAPSQEGRANTGGYALLWRDTARPCSAYVQESCLDSQSMDACTHALTAQLLAGQQQEGNRGLQPGVLAAAIAVPVCIVALAAAGVGFWCHNRHTTPTHGPRTLDKRRTASPHGLLGGDLDVERGSRGPNTDPDGSGGPAAKAEAEPLSRRPLGLQAGWSVARACTTPYLGHVDDDNIEFGELIGSGSFGRVFAAKWAGRDVAVKVIEHNTDTTVPVEREVALMLSFNHPHIVRAFHFVTRVHSSEVMPHTTNSSSNKDTDVTKSNSAGSSDSNPHAAAAAAITAAQNSSNASGSGCQPTARPLPPLPPAKPAGDGSSNASSSGNSRASAGGGSSDKRCGVGSVGNPQLQLVQRLPSLTGATPRLVHKVETWLVQEYCDCGTLAAVAAEWRSEPESDQKMLERLQLLQDCARGLQELHSRNVVHGDLNARNVLLSSSAVAPLGVVAKLADLGLSRIVRSHRTHHSTNTVGTMSHVAPELLRYGHMSTAGDIYAFGIVMWELYTGQPAFSKLHVGQFFEAVVVRNLRPKIPRGMAADYQLLMQSCWSADPADRPSCERLLNCLKLMVQVRQQRLGAAAPGAAMPCSPLLLYPQQQQQQLQPATGPGTYAGGFSAPLPAAASLGGSRMQRTPQQQQGSSIPAPVLGLEHGSILSAAAAASSHARSSADVQQSGYYPMPAAGGPAASALPGLLALLKERAPHTNQQQLMREMAGGRQHSSCPADTRDVGGHPGGAEAGLWEYMHQRLTPINTGRRASAESSLGPPVSHSQSDPLPHQGGVGYSMQQQILMQLEQQRLWLLQREQYLLLNHQQQQFQEQGPHSPELPSGSFLSFPEASLGGGGSSTQTPWLTYQQASLSSSGGTATHTTPLTGLTYNHPSASSSSGGGSSTAGGPLSLPAAFGSRRLSTDSIALPGAAVGAATAPLPSLPLPTLPLQASGSSDGAQRLSGPLPRLPGAAAYSLIRSGSLGAAWYWQRSAPGSESLNPGGPGCEGGEHDAGSVTDQDGLVDQLGGEAQQQGPCLDVVAQLQTELVHV